MVTEDWLMRQVDSMARSMALLVFHKEDTAYVPSGDETADGLHAELMARLAAGDPGGAEDLLFEAAESGGLGCLEVGVDFYARLNQLTDEQLEEAGFGRDEIQEGLQDLSRQLGVVL